ncbi:hypothetical protein M378DRAFT_9540 [Amanita muscaria Koide BX008]|uniref:Uncharacterized protein n=1 Tax=Amanita muscaria (strain Koide BX008) TaxID=946122 RepID=A0A0C2XCZ2_AMAMK|nr:hypothetical protein M378DRAFT_9540 [Amanita muscaria Koide BX008]
MKLNYVLLPEGYIPTHPRADTASDDEMDVDEVSIGEPMEVDDVEVCPKQRVVRVTVDAVVPAGEPMEVGPAPAQRWPVLPRPAWNVDAADCAPAQRWPVLPRPAWNVDMADYAKVSPALIVGGTRVARRSPRKPSSRKTTAPQRSAPPSSPQMAKPVVSAHPHVNMSKIVTSSKVKLEDMPILFASVETSSSSLNVAHQVKCKEPDARCIRKTRFSSPLSPVKESKIDDKLFLTSNRRSPDLITNVRWLKISRTPGRNIYNESVSEGCSDADYSRLAVAYPPTQDADTLFPEIKRFSSVKHARMDEDFFIKANRQAPDLAVNNRWLKISRAPDHNIYNEPTTVEDDDDDDTDYSSLCMGYSPSEDVEDSLPEIDFAEADTSLNWAPRILTPETPRRIQRMTLFSPLSPGRQSNLDEDDRRSGKLQILLTTTFYPSCETVSEAASRTDLSSSTSMDLLIIVTMSNLVINEGPALEEGITNETAAGNERKRKTDLAMAINYWLRTLKSMTKVKQ